MKRVQGLDGVRGLAILWVLVYHLYALVPKAPWWAKIPGLQGFANLGWIGVSLFFALSGYLIIPMLAAQKGDPHYFGRFWCRRAFRLLPLYLALIASFFVAAAWWPESSPGHERLFHPGIPPWSYAVFLQNFWMSVNGYLGNEWLRVSWSLAVEVQFYVMASLIVFCAPRPRLAGWLVGLIILALLFRSAVVWLNPGASAPLVVLLPSRLDAFLAGGLVALWPPRGPGRDRAALALVVLVLSAAGFGWFATGGFGQATRFAVPLYHLLLATGCAALLELAVGASPLVRWLTENAVVIRAGRLSYFVYLFHIPVMWVAFAVMFKMTPNLESGQACAIMAGVIVTLWGLAELSYRWIEAPLIERGRTYFAGSTQGRGDSSERV